jgi:hypothetical protein
MAITYRPMRAKDVRECVEIVAVDPVVGPRYGNAIGNLPAVWLELLRREAFRAIVLEHSSKGSGVETVGVGASVFVSEEFFREVKTPPFFWAGPEITKRIVCGTSPVLTNKQVRHGNSKAGLNLIVWEGVVRASYFTEPEAHHTMLAGFLETHRGFHLKELLGHGTNELGLEATFRMGNLFLSSVNGTYIDHMEKTAQELLSVPHFIGISRELALRRIGTWIGSLFICEPPQLGLRPSEQRLLLTALRGGRDEDLAHELGLSLSAVKKRWLSIYERVAACDSRIIPTAGSGHEGASERGKEKKQRLLVYLREHPEELRPASP